MVYYILLLKGFVCSNYAGTVKGPTSITRLEVLKMSQKIASFSFRPPTPTLKRLFGGGV